MKKKLKEIPLFENESQERKFWETHDTLDYFDISKAKKAIFPNLKKRVAIEQYKNGSISLGKMAEFLDIGKLAAISLVHTLGIDWLDYREDEIDEQVKTADKYFKTKNQKNSL
jgi:predicted HTH domain antitoxin